MYRPGHEIQLWRTVTVRTNCTSPNRCRFNRSPFRFEAFGIEPPAHSRLTWLHHPPVNGHLTMPNPQHAILTNLTKYQWYTHLSRTDGADLGVIKKALKALRTAGSDVGVTVPVNVCVLFGPTLLADLTSDIPNDFQPYPGYESSDGKVAKATQDSHRDHARPAPPKTRHTPSPHLGHLTRHSGHPLTTSPRRRRRSKQCSPDRR